jgi:hypothetical protein
MVIVIGCFVILKLYELLYKIRNKNTAVSKIISGSVGKANPNLKSLSVKITDNGVKNTIKYNSLSADKNAKTMDAKTPMINGNQNCS